MQKFKSMSFSGVLSVIKSCLLGLITTLIGIVIFAFVLKFSDLSTSTVSWVNNVIKAVSIFIVIASLKRMGGEKLLIKSIFAGALYAVLSFVIFSILNGSFSFNLSFVYDLIFSVVVAIIASIILNLFNRKGA